MSHAPPSFFYFDLGNVLLLFDRQRVARQMAKVAGVAPDRVWHVLYETDLLARYESGRISTSCFFESFCQEVGTKPDPAELYRAASDIFEINVPVVPIVAHLTAAGQRLGILSNTNEMHWNYIVNGRYTVVRRCFEKYALSYELGAMKPEAEIFRAAAELARTPAEKIFFVDDHLENVLGARQAGFDAVQFQDARQLAADLRSRGVRWNY